MKYLLLALLLGACVVYGTPERTGIITPIGSASTADDDDQNAP